MYYHVRLDLGNDSNWWVNHDYDSLLQNVLVPFINKQVVPARLPPGKAIFNLSTATYLRIYKTNEPFHEAMVDLKQRLNAPEFAQHECTQEIIDQFLVRKSPVEAKSLLQTLFLPAKPQVFVIMKFRDKLLDSAYEGAIKPIIKKFKLKPLRIDEIQDSGRITNQILEEIASSEIILADLTGERPNCYYEAGFAHAIGKEIIFTIQRGSAIHFDLAGYRFIEWETEEDLRRELQKRFRAIRQGKNRK